jgi:hypothetical protein
MIDTGTLGKTEKTIFSHGDDWSDAMTFLKKLRQFRRRLLRKDLSHGITSRYSKEVCAGQ